MHPTPAGRARQPKNRPEGQPLQRRENGIGEIQERPASEGRALQRQEKPKNGPREAGAATASSRERRARGAAYGAKAAALRNSG